MPQEYLPRFSELFAKLSGHDTAQATADENGWLLLPPNTSTDEQVGYDYGVIKVLGSRADANGLWVKPWPNLKAKKFVMLTLNEGARFVHLRGALPGQRHAYYVHAIRTGSITCAPMLLGQFLAEIEQAGDEALNLDGGGTNRIYYPRDKAIASYDQPTAEELGQIRSRLQALSEGYVGRRGNALREVCAAA